MPTPIRPVLLRAALRFLPLALLATGVAGTVYLVAQQGLRGGADSPQLQLAEDAASALNAGQAPSAVVGSSPVDTTTSLAPFVVVFDVQDHVVAAGGQLDGQPPSPPPGMLDAAAVGDPNRVTWQPRPGLRFATVTARWSGGTVMAARSLREVERLEDRALALVGLAWGATLGVLALICVFVELASRRLAGGAPAGR